MMPPTRLIILLAFMGSVPLSSYAADRVALVIGVNQYENLPGNAQLRVAVSDAELMASSLSALDPPFQVTLLTDVLQKTAEEKFDDFLQQASGADCALLYFAGHGIEYHGANYLLVKDTAISEISPDVDLMKRRLGREALSLQAMVDSLDSTGAQVKLVVLDCCRDNPLSATAPGGSRSVVGGQSGLAQVAAPSGTLISYSADAGQKANDGLFTAVLAENLKKPGLTAVQVFATTRDQVREMSTAWAEEDAKKGLEPDFRRVRHEPAEYTKLNLAGTNFTFSRGVPVGVMADGAATTEELTALQAHLVAAKRAKEEAERRAAVMSSTTAPTTTDTFVASTGMEGTHAGEVRNFAGIDMVWCPPGEFMMGSPASESRNDNETLHQVKLTRGFWLAKLETTQEQWESVMGTNVTTLKASGAADTTYGEVNATGRFVPMYFTSWEDAQGWLAKMNEHHPLPAGWQWDLPTEAQWEYACRAGTETETYAGALSVQGVRNAPALDPIAWYSGNSSLGYTNIGLDTSDWEEKQYPGGTAGAAEVGLKIANDWGLHDMLGNVWEWCADWFEDYPSGVATNPTGATEGSYRVYRGGAWFGNAVDCRSALRHPGMLPENRSHDLGFRPAVVPTSQ